MMRECRRGAIRRAGPGAALALLLCGCTPALLGYAQDGSITSEPRFARPKNVILFIGDGMGISTVTAARIYDGQSRGQDGESNVLAFERFPHVALVKTYNSNQQVPDSAGTATAMQTGVKTRSGVIGIGPEARRTDCRESLAATLPTVGELAAANGQQVAFVTTARITHATPAAIYAHAADRNWENDRAIPETERGKGCRDIAAQLIEFPFAIAMGGGNDHFFGSDRGGKRLDPAADLPAEWTARTTGTYATTAAEMRAAASRPGPLLGIFGRSTMSYTLHRKPDSTEPTLTEMTGFAIDRLSRAKGGYYLMVEGGNIDHGHHEGRAETALADAQEFVRAIELALSKVDLSETLVLVTADHSHTLTIGGWPTRNNPILGLVVENDARGEPKSAPALATDGQPFTTLGYYNGPGAIAQWPRPAPADGADIRQQAVIPTGDVFGERKRLSETHGGEDVALYATGRGSELVGGVIEQNRIFDIIVRSLGLEKPSRR